MHSFLDFFLFLLIILHHIIFLNQYSISQLNLVLYAPFFLLPLLSYRQTSKGQIQYSGSATNEGCLIASLLLEKCFSSCKVDYKGL